ncbi:hypothetical protein BC829DRAFT_58022 [Chytridium lagenaria]|nr:hypothetical protein BC829DRAFT_58022 [Chytridium lagenaria]
MGITAQLEDARTYLVEMRIVLREVPVPRGSEKVDVMMDRIISHASIPTLPPPPTSSTTANAFSPRHPNNPHCRHPIHLPPLRILDPLLRTRNDIDSLKSRADAALRWLFTSILHIAKVRDALLPNLKDSRTALVMHRLLEMEACASSPVIVRRVPEAESAFGRADTTHSRSSNGSEGTRRLWDGVGSFGGGDTESCDPLILIPEAGVVEDVGVGG